MRRSMARHWIGMRGVPLMARLLNLNQVAEAMSVSRSTVERLVRSGALTSHKVGRARRVSEQALTAYIARTEMPAPSRSGQAPRPFRHTGKLGEGPDPLAPFS